MGSIWIAHLVAEPSHGVRPERRWPLIEDRGARHRWRVNGAVGVMAVGSSTGIRGRIPHAYRRAKLGP
jgi:hypothetical protein